MRLKSKSLSSTNDKYKIFYDSSSDERSLSESSSNASVASTSEYRGTRAALEEGQKALITETPWSNIPVETLLGQLEQLEGRVGQLTAENEQLRHLKVDNAKLAAEKQQVSQELEELTRSLFEEANTLVASEAKARYLAEVQVGKLEKELLASRLHLAEEMEQLEELKRKMEVMSTEHSHTAMNAVSFIGEQGSAEAFSRSGQPKNFWNLFMPDELHEVAYPEMSFAESKQFFFKKSPTNVPSSDPSEGHSEVDIVDKDSKLSEIVPDDKDSDGRSDGPCDSTVEPHEDVDQLAVPAKPAYCRLAVNEAWLYSHFDASSMNEFLHCLGRSTHHESVLAKIAAVRKSLVTNAPIDSLDTGSVDYLTASDGKNGKGAHSSTVSLQSPGSITPTPMSSLLSRPLTPNAFGAATAFRSYLGKHLPSAPIYRSFPGEYKKTGDVFLKRVYDEDIYPTLSFPLRTRQFVKQVLAVLAVNKLTFEKHIIIYRDVAGAAAASIQKPVDPPTSQTPVTQAASDTLGSHEDFTETAPLSNIGHSESKETIKMAKCCEFCGQALLPFPDMHSLTSPLEHSWLELLFNRPCEAYRLLIEDPHLASPFGKAVFVVDKHCRDKIIAVCDFFTFVRYIKAGFYQHLSNEALYVKWMHIKRNLFYARSGTAPYFVAHDINKLVHMAEAKLSS